MTLRYLTAGESHGRCLTAILEGLPAGVPVSKWKTGSSARTAGEGRVPTSRRTAGRSETGKRIILTDYGKEKARSSLPARRASAYARLAPRECAEDCD